MITYSEIISALRDCKFHTGRAGCEACSLYDDCRKQRRRVEDVAADIIEQLIARTERLQKLYAESQNTVSDTTGKMLKYYVAARDYERAWASDVKQMKKLIDENDRLSTELLAAIDGIGKCVCCSCAKTGTDRCTGADGLAVSCAAFEWRGAE